MSSDTAVLLRKIREAKHFVAFTGAGVSTLSGIRDFRGKNGLYNDPLLAADAEKIFDIDYFEKDPSLYYTKAADFIYNINERKPSIVHTVLGELEKQGYLKAVITQNIDLLHQKGGSKKVIEIHGSPETHYCLSCAGIKMGFDEAARIVLSGSMPRCSQCGRVLKPSITFFGESLPVNALREAADEAEKADFMLILGSSLTVFPAAALPEQTLRNGGEIAIVNNMPTCLDCQAVMLLDDLGAVFEEISNSSAAWHDEN